MKNNLIQKKGSMIHKQSFILVSVNIVEEYLLSLRIKQVIAGKHVEPGH